MLQIEKIPVDIMTTCLTVITPEGEEVGWNPGMLPSRHRTDGWWWCWNVGGWKWIDSVV